MLCVGHRKLSLGWDLSDGGSSTLEVMCLVLEVSVADEEPTWLRQAASERAAGSQAGGRGDTNWSCSWRRISWSTECLRGISEGHSENQTQRNGLVISWGCARELEMASFSSLTFDFCSTPSFFATRCHICTDRTISLWISYSHVDF